MTRIFGLLLAVIISNTASARDPLIIGLGGTGQTTASAAINALLPSQTGNSGYCLMTNGTLAAWAACTGGGGGADVHLSNLTAPTAIPESLLPATGGAINLGSTVKYWSELFVEYVGDTDGVARLNISTSATTINGGITGDVAIYPGVGGKFIVADGTEGTSGECIVSYGTDGEGHWDTCPGGAGSGVTTMAAVGAVPNADGASISGVTLTLQPADATHPGVVKAGAQTFAGPLSVASFVGALTGNASTATALAANPADCASDTYATTIAASGNLTCATVTDAGLAVSYLKADGSRGLSADWNAGAHTITATTFAGNASTATALAANPSDCASDTYATIIAANGDLTCGAVTDAGLAVSYLKADGSRGLSGDWNAGAHDITASTFTGLASTATLATNATNTGVTNDTTTNATMYPTWVTANTGNLPQKVSSTKLTFNPSTGLLTSTGFNGPLTGAVTGNADTATALAANPSDCASDTYATTIAASGNLTCATVTDAGLALVYLKADGSRGLSADWNAGAHDITANTFIGALTGLASTATLATNATNTAITNDTATNATMYPTWVTANTGNLPQKVSSTKLSFNPSTGILTSTGFAGPITGAVTGNADTATALAANPAACAADTWVTDTAANGNLTCTTVTDAGLAVSYLKANGTRALTGNWNVGAFDITANTFIGALTGLASTATLATNSTNIAITNDTTTAATMYPVWVTANTGNLPAKVSSTKLSFNPSTGMLTSTGFTGPLTGNADTATTAAAWTTARNLAGNSVSGSGNVAFANKFIVQGTADAGLSAAQFLGALGTGIVKNTTTTGVLSIAVALDFPTLNQSTTGNADTATLATTATNVTIANDTTTNAVMYPTWVTANTGNLPPKVSSTKLSFNPSTGILTSTGFAGPLTGAVTGNADTATAATNTAITNDTTTNAVMYPTWVTANTGNLPQKVSSTKLSFNPSTGILTSTGFAGPITGAVTGNADTATALFANPAACAADTYVTDTAANGNLTCNTVTNAGLAGSIAASKLVGSDIATVGTITSGTWSATTIAVNKGGTGVTSVTSAPSATVWAGWDSNANMSADNHIQGYRTQATAAGTTTLVVDDKEQQYFTGVTTQDCVLPVATTMVNGQHFIITNLSSGVVTVKTSGSNTVQAMAANTQLIATIKDSSGGTGTASWNWTYQAAQNALTNGTVTSVAATVPGFLSISGSPVTTSGTLAISYSGTALPIANGGTAVTSVTTAPTASSFAGWDANRNLSADSFLVGFRTQATAAGTTTLVVDDVKKQFFTGVTTQTVALPVATTMANGQEFEISNLSSGVVTVQTSGGNALQAMAANTKLIATVKDSAGGTGLASWSWEYPTMVTSAAIPVASGGTGLATLTAHALYVGNGTSAPTALSVGATGTILKGTSTSDPSFTATPVLGASGTTGTLGFAGTTSGTVTVTPADAAGTYNFILPITSGAAGQLLTSGGGGTTAMTWADHGAINFITNSAAEVGTTGWATYADAAGASPVNGTAGSATVTWTRATSTPLTETGNFLFTKDAANRQGDGASFDFTIDTASQAKVLSIDFDYVIGSGTFVAGTSTVDSDIKIFIYDVTNSVLIEPSTTKLYSNSSTVPAHFTSNFQTASNSTSYRLIFHTATTSASAYTVKFDSVVVTPSKYVYGTPITDWKTCPTITGVWVTNTTYTGFCRRVGDELEVRGLIALAGAPTGTLTINLPTGYTIDTAKLLSSTALVADYGYAVIRDTGTTSYDGVIRYNSTTSVAISAKGQGGTYIDLASQVTATVPQTFANTDEIHYWYSVPILGWTSTVQMSDSADQREVSARYTNTAGTSIANSGDIAVPFATKDYDTHSAFATDTYTIPVAGRYHIGCQINFASSLYAASNAIAVAIYKNGATTGYGPEYLVGGTPTGGVGVSSQTTLNLIAGDTIVCRAVNNRTAGATLLDTTAGRNSFEIRKITGPSSIGATETIAARYFASTSTPGTSGTTNGITYTTKDYDTHGMCTGGATCTLPAAGKYRISACVYQTATTTAANQVVVVVIAKNAVNTAFNVIMFTSATSKPLSNCVTDTVNGVAGDAITFKAGNDATTPALSASNVANYFTIERIGL